MSRIDELERLVAPAVAEAGFELVDIELMPNPRVLRVSVDAEGGVVFDRLSELSRRISQLVDESAAAPNGHYDLEVSSPGLERPLRRPEHFRRAVGQLVKVRTNPGVEGPRRAEGVLAAATDEGIKVTTEDHAEGERFIAYGDIERARTGFDWQGALASPGGKGAKQ
jgi:ribosome maturation factor RimP